jgi:glycosyltransferase involved in cell wall biosynthesis
MRNLLFTSIAFPPKSDPECLQTAKYFYHLQKYSELQIEVLTSANPTLYMPVDENLRRYDTGFTNKVELTIPENKYWNYFQRVILNGGNSWPDSKKGFHRQWKKATKLIRNQPDVIYSRSFPLSSSVMALRLQEYYKVPWIMHLSDPWADCPVEKYPSKKYQIHRTMERACLEKASYVCLTSELTIELYRKSYPEYSDKYLYFPNVYDSQDMKPNPHHFGDKIRVVYTGGLVGSRNISYLLNALELLNSRNSEILNKFDFVFAGAMDRQSTRLFQQNTFPNIQHVGLLSYDQAQALQRSADILLVIDNPVDDPNHAVFFPSKLLDYLMAQRRILAITPLEGTSHRVLDSINCNTFTHDDREGLVKELETIANAYLQRDDSYFYFKDLPEIYSASYNAGRLKDLILDLVER